MHLNWIVSYICNISNRIQQGENTQYINNMKNKYSQLEIWEGIMDLKVGAKLSTECVDVHAPKFSTNHLWGWFDYRYVFCVWEVQLEAKLGSVRSLRSEQIIDKLL